MRPNAVRKQIAEGKRIINGWCAIPNSYSAELMSHAGFDSVTIDLQHGPVDFRDAVTMLQAISTTACTPMVRVPWNEPGIIMKLLDAGAMGVICPMINTKAEAEAFVSWGRYPPVGQRSNGANRAVQYNGADYQPNANAEVLLLAMIETTTALDNLDAILSVPGLSGVYVGPTDLSLSLGKPATLDPSDKTVLAAMQTICDKAKARGLIAGVHVDSPATAKKRFADGYQLCTLLNDARLLLQAATSFVKETRGEAQVVAAKSY
jgi:4-hydroxy-2-oxoheptanedioate aldolase